MLHTLKPSDLESPSYKPLNPRKLRNDLVTIQLEERQIETQISLNRLPECYTREEHETPTVYKSIQPFENNEGLVIVKSSWLTSPHEAANLEYVRQHTSIPVPSVLFSKLDEGTGKTMIGMSYIEGEKLSDIWPDLSPKQKNKIKDQFNIYIAELRSLTPGSPPVLGSADGSGVRDIRDRQLAVPATGPPCSSVEGFEDWLLHTITPAPSLLNLQKHAINRLKNIRRAKPGGGKIVFTHGRLIPDNIIVQRLDIGSASNSGSSEGEYTIKGILDWSAAGWYPEYWEFVQGMEKAFWSDEDWADLLEDCLPGYRDEYLLFEYIGAAFDH